MSANDPPTDGRDVTEMFDTAWMRCTCGYTDDPCQIHESDNNCE